MFILQEETVRFLSATAASAITRGRFVVRSGTDAALADASVGAEYLGVAREGAATDEPVRLYPMGTVAKVEAGAALSRATAGNHWITTDSVGRAVAWTATSGLPRLGRWLPMQDSGTATVAVGERITVELSNASATHQILAYGTATIAIGTAAIAVQLDADLDGLATLISVGTDATATLVSYAWDGSGKLTITADANATAATEVTYLVIG